jgi:glycine hydroxymethyltransferase
MVSSGIRIGTPALATRGFGADDFAEVADVIATALRPATDDRAIGALRERVAELAARHPLYPALEGNAE